MQRIQSLSAVVVGCSLTKCMKVLQTELHTLCWSNKTDTRV